MKSIKYCMVFFILNISSSLIAQSAIEFKYDNAGNRIKRELLFKKSNEANHDSISTIVPVSEWIDDMKITLYPNPTEGKLTVQITNFLPEFSGGISVFDLDGKVLLQQNSISQINQLDLSALPAGLYLLRINWIKGSSEWRIIKQ